jgi:hypothetical protein
LFIEPRSKNLSFLLRLKYNEFGPEFLRTSRSDNDLYREFLFWFFWNF